MTHDIVFANPVAELSAVSICPDYVVNRGHYFRTFLPEELPLSDTEKRGLLEIIKTYEPELLSNGRRIDGIHYQVSFETRHSSRHPISYLESTVSYTATFSKKTESRRSLCFRERNAAFEIS